MIADMDDLDAAVVGGNKLELGAFIRRARGNGELVQWIRREKYIYLPHTRRDGTLAGFREHVRTLFDANLKLKILAVDAFGESDIELR